MTVVPVSRALTEADRVVFAEEGVSVPRLGKKRSREKPRELATSQSSKESTSADLEEEWQEVRKYLDPNPQLKAYNERRSAEKV